MKTPFMRFAVQWIAKNVDDSLYSEMKQYVLQLAKVLNSQNHSGGSGIVVMKYFIKMLVEYGWMQD